ncbi:LuxR C-terminal-related transcriptional regulator [Peptoniphilus phoceensis]|uniref:LuxR C-terminal-related transcriptional regulator n=1 Tax=Peptoniphilus phoceensis TaxID=1720298 RepID=UPI0007820991|nr:LuxR C-terminal-related transcriptional regulator [Peptoniphilus phoceensis]
MIKIALETKSEIIKRGLQNILEGYEVLDFYEDKDKDFDLLIFEDLKYQELNIDKIALVDEKNLPLIIECSFLSFWASEEEVLEAVDKTLRGYLYIEERLKKVKRDRNEKFKKIKTLNKREKYLLEEIILGKTNKEISREIFVSEKTIKNNLTDLYKKLNVSGRREIVKKYSQIKD